MIDCDLLAYLEDYLTENRKERFRKVLSERTKFLTVAIEDVYQMHNTSAILRSCDAFGIQEVHSIEGRFGDKLDKNIALGAQQWVDLVRHQNTTDCIKTLKERGYSIVATVPHQDAYSLSEFQVGTKTAVFFGTEWEGLSTEVLERADRFLKIPMVGFSESLNVSVSAAIIIQQLADNLRKTTLPWQLTQTELLEKRLDWTKKSIKKVEQIISRYQGN